MNRIVRAAATTIFAGLVATTALAGTAAATQSGSADSGPAKQEQTTARFATLEDAVAAGVLDQALVDTVRSKGSTDAIVTLQQADVLAETASVGDGSASEVERDQKKIVHMKGASRRKSTRP